MNHEPVNDTAFRFGPYAGFNWQISQRWVVGVEGDYGLARKTTTLNGMFAPVTGSSPGITFGITGQQADTFSVKTTWDASARARLGFLVTPTFLLYATGGPAWMHVSAISNCATLNGCGSFTPAVITDSSTRLGWTAGGGIETALWDKWLARAEYRYADYGSVIFTDVRSGGLSDTYVLPMKSHAMTFGLAYKFGDQIVTPAPAMKPLPPVVAGWGGAYVGAAVGMRAALSDPMTTYYAGSVLSPAGCLTAGCFTGQPMNSVAFRLGSYAGYNWQLGPRWIVGIEGDFGWANNRTTLNSYTYPSFPGLTATTSDAFAVKADWDTSFRGRLGYRVTPTTMLYGTGGLAFQHIVTTSTSTTPNWVVADDRNRVGWTVGGGAETMLWGNWSARAEYRFADFGTRTNTDTVAAGVTPVIYDMPIRTHMALLGLTYKLGGGWTR